MRTVSSKLVIISLLIICFTGMQINLNAQKIKNMDPVTYLQLPTLDPVYGSVDVFVEADQSGTREALSIGFGKLAGKKEGEKSSMDDFVNKVFANQVEKYGNWSLYEGNIAPPDGATTLKAVIKYSPDDGARPMGAPMKNNQQQYTFSYRVKAEMRIYNDKDELLIAKDFGVITGQGHSTDWPQNATSAGSMFSVTTTEEGETSAKHPYEVACIEGAIEQTNRVLYGLYGIKEFEVPLTVAIINKQKESKDYFEKYKEIMEGKSHFLLNDSETAQMQSCVDYWESILATTKEEYLWAVHYNLAIGYGWLLNAEKSQEHINQFETLKKDTFDKIINKSGSFTNKDTDVLDAYNMAQPFAQYYALGINLHPDWPALLEMDVYTSAQVLGINFVIANALDMPLPLPVFPLNPQEINMKKCTGVISENDLPLMEFSYKINKGELEELEIKGEKKTKGDGIKETFTIPSQKSLPKSERRHVDQGFIGYTFRGVFALTGDNKLEIYNMSFKKPYVWNIFRLDHPISEELTEIQSELGDLYADSFQNGLISDMSYTGFDWYSSEFKIEDPSAHVTITCDDINTAIEAVNPDENGIPAQYKVNWDLKAAYFSIYATIKSKFGEETYHEQTRRMEAQKENAPVIEKMLQDVITQKGGTIEPAKNKKGDDGYNISVTQTYDFSAKLDDKGNWTELKLGAYTITREIKY